VSTGLAGFDCSERWEGSTAGINVQFPFPLAISDPAAMRKKPRLRNIEWSPVIAGQM
jgi:hypothetical protein